MQIKKLREDAERTSDYAKIKEDVVTLSHEKNLLISQLEKAQNDLVDLKVKIAEAERVAALGAHSHVLPCLAALHLT